MLACIFFNYQETIRPCFSINDLKKILVIDSLACVPVRGIFSLSAHTFISV